MRRLIWIVASVGALGCGGDSSVAAPKPVQPAVPDISGRYSLATVDDRALPQVVGYDGLGAMDALSGLIELTTDAHFSDILTWRRRGAGGIEIHVDTVRGTFLRADRTVLLVPDDQSEPYFFDLHDGRMTGFGPLFTVVYVRR